MVVSQADHERYLDYQFGVLDEMDRGHERAKEQELENNMPKREPTQEMWDKRDELRGVWLRTRKDSTRAKAAKAHRDQTWKIYQIRDPRNREQT